MKKKIDSKNSGSSFLMPAYLIIAMSTCHRLELYFLCSEFSTIMNLITYILRLLDLIQVSILIYDFVMPAYVLHPSSVFCIVETICYFDSGHSLQVLVLYKYIKHCVLTNILRIRIIIREYFIKLFHKGVR